nr:hypothetical protein Q903MT_gene180 [Picea sitchensis]
MEIELTELVSLPLITLRISFCEVSWGVHLIREVAGNFPQLEPIPLGTHCWIVGGTAWIFEIQPYYLHWKDDRSWQFAEGR